MTRQIAMSMHVLAIGLQFANELGLVVPSQYAKTFAIVLAGAQAVLGWFQHNFNPDGTPSTTAFIPK